MKFAFVYASEKKSRGTKVFLEFKPRIGEYGEL
jgi:hypothetical protein